MEKIFDGVVTDIKLHQDSTILTVFDNEQQKNVVGVIDNKAGSICIPFEFDFISYKPKGQTEAQFIGNVEEEKTYFDADGFYPSDLNSKINSQKKIGVKNRNN